MDYCMTIRAYGTQIRDGIDNVTFANLSQRTKMVNMNTSSVLAKFYHEIKAANRAAWAVMREAGCASTRVALIRIYGHTTHRALPELLFRGYLISAAVCLQAKRLKVYGPNVFEFRSGIRKYRHATGLSIPMNVAKLATAERGPG